MGDDGSAGAAARRSIKRDLEQWFFRITKYADELLNSTASTGPSGSRSMQTNWIGRSEGAEVDFTPRRSSTSGGQEIVFTTRPDTLCGATFMVLAPEHPLVDDAHHARPQRGGRGLHRAGPPPDRDRAPVDGQGEDRRLHSARYAINPVNGERIPIWIADYVLIGYGTGAIMAVPAHDERDFEFAAAVRAADPAGRRAAGQ